MNTYGAIWKDQEAVIEAETLYGAQKAAVTIFQANTRKKVKGYEITVRLMALNGETYTQPTDF
jgi:NADP-dependent 3-hydroxy acid dehydrogenase YdfG